MLVDRMTTVNVWVAERKSATCVRGVQHDDH